MAITSYQIWILNVTLSFKCACRHSYVGPRLSWVNMNRARICASLVCYILEADTARWWLQCSQHMYSCSHVEKCACTRRFQAGSNLKCTLTLYLTTISVTLTESDLHIWISELHKKLVLHVICLGARELSACDFVINYSCTTPLSLFQLPT